MDCNLATWTFLWLVNALFLLAIVCVAFGFLVGFGNWKRERDAELAHAAGVDADWLAFQQNDRQRREAEP